MKRLLCGLFVYASLFAQSDTDGLRLSTGSSTTGLTILQPKLVHLRKLEVVPKDSKRCFIAIAAQCFAVVGMEQLAGVSIETRVSLNTDSFVSVEQAEGALLATEMMYPNITNGLIEAR